MYERVVVVTLSINICHALILEITDNEPLIRYERKLRTFYCATCLNLGLIVDKM